MQNISKHLQPSLSTSNLQTLRKKNKRQILEYEDIFQRNSKQDINIDKYYSLSDIFARESDVTISSQVTPLTEYYGYGLWWLITISEALFLFWGLTDKYYLNLIGIYYYPSRWWFLALNCTLLMVMLFIYVSLPFWFWEHETPKLNDLVTLVDQDQFIEKDWETYGWKESNGVLDLRISDVNRILYDQDVENQN